MYILIYFRLITKSYCIAQGTLLNGMWQRGWEGSWRRMDMCICMAESLCCPPEITTILLIGSTPIQNKKFKGWGEKKSKSQ